MSKSLRNNKLDIRSKGLIFLVTGSLLCVSCSKKIIPAESKNTLLSQEDNIKYEYTFFEACRNKMIGNVEPALLLFNECIKMNPNSDASWYEVSSIYAFLGKKNEALRAAEKAYNIHPENHWYLIQLANLYNAFGMNDSTVWVYEKVVKKYPDRIDYLYNLGALYHQANRMDDAIKVYKEIENSTGVNEQVNMAKYRAYYQMGKHDKAAEELEKLISTFPDDVRFHGILAELYSEFNDNVKAENVYRELMAKYPKNGTAQLSYSEFLRKQKNYDGALEFLEKAYVNDDLDIESKIESCVSYMSNPEEFEKYHDRIGKLVDTLYYKYGGNVKIKTLYADYLLRTEKRDEAEVMLNQIIEEEKSNFLVWQELIFILNERGEYEKMMNIAEKALTYFKEAPDLYLYKAIAESQTGKYKNAVNTIQSGLQKADNNPNVKMQLEILLAETYNDMNLYNKSDELFEEILKKDPNNTIVLNNYAYYLSLRGKDLEKALIYSKKAITAEPENFTYIDTYAWILYRMKRYKEALKYIEDAVKLGGDKDSDIIDHLGDILFMNGRVDEAVNAWKKAIDNGGEQEKIQIKIDKRSVIDKQ